MLSQLDNNKNTGIIYQLKRVFFYLTFQKEIKKKTFKTASNI